MPTPVHTHTREKRKDDFFDLATGSRAKYLDGLFSNTGVAPSDDDDFSSQVRNVVNSELGLWSEEAFNENRVERFTGDGEKGRVGHV
jgi:hypothetical protein